MPRAYRGPSPAMQDVMGGMVPCGFLASPTVGPIIRDGKLVPIAVSGSKRLGSQPDVPTVAEARVKGFNASFAEMMAAPSGRWDQRVSLLQGCIEIMARPGDDARLRELAPKKSRMSAPRLTPAL